MSELFTFMQENGQLLLTGAVLMLLLVVLVNQARLLGRTKKLQKNIDGITEKVEAYLAVVMGTDEGETAAEAESAQMEQQRSSRREEENSRLISAVLQEIFP